MAWDHIDWEREVWDIPAIAMQKTASAGEQQRPHIVPLSRQALALLRDLHALTGRRRYAFPSKRKGDKHLTTVAIGNALKRLGYAGKQTTHGFRATARTLLDEQLGQRPDVIEHQSAHAVKDPNGRAYNRTTYLSQRAEMMQIWADYLDGLRQTASGDNIVMLDSVASTVTGS
jgi:integrase